MRRRCIRGRECADMLEDLCCAEVDVERDGKRRVRLELMMSGAVINVNECDEEELGECQFLILFISPTLSSA
eukprot:3988935-Ditylum_brightwellii.AAC.1